MSSSTAPIITSEVPAPFDPWSIRSRFPVLTREVRPGVPLVYLDNAATSLKPWSVIRAVQSYDTEFTANVHRGLHTLSEEATAAYEEARTSVARYIHARDESEIIFTRGTTESINLVALSFGRTRLQPGDEIVLTALEHHANLVPWLMLARERGVVLRYAELHPDGTLDLDSLDRQIGSRTRLVAFSGMSNVLGTLLPIAEIVARAQAVGAATLLDAAQLVAHGPLDVAALGVDFAAFSGHKMFGPTGIGILYGRRERLEAMPPVLGGGDMVLEVHRDRAEWNELPYKFEAGTPPIAQAIGLGAAVQFLAELDWDAITAHQQQLVASAQARLASISGVRLFSAPAYQNGGVVSFTVDGVHPHDLAQILDRRGVAIRAGQHCAMPLHETLGIPASARASFCLYNCQSEVESLAQAVEYACSVFHRSDSRSPNAARKSPADG
ncbi:MAG: cysteine desulfurase [Isosphaeraceae bacterium]|nr:MAG: cysteine desulfurase [Isosphaeraceae bacterium]